MARKKYQVTVSEEEQQKLLELTRKGKIKAREFKRAMIILKANEGLTDPQIMAALNVSRPCVERIRKRYVTGGLEKALHEDPRPGQKRKLDGRLKDHIPDDPTLTTEVQAITIQWNSTHATVDWQFRTPDARIRLKRLYPSISE